MTTATDDRLKAWSHWLGAHALAIRTIEARMKAAGQPPIGWYDVLLELDRAGGRMRIGELAERLVIEPYNMTRLLDRLEQAGLLRRERASDDRRSAFAVLTEEGVELRQQMWPHYRQAILDVFGESLSDKEAEGLVRTFKKLIPHLRAESRDPGEPD